ncbi:ribonuclease H-like domain-containing protein [Tanacetum coccineum]|uniref:Ribonuclease H-like domain-containing protein n=1 Tax=Tanacetum coccineum TaxID=301880 RepID=A0ABQ5FXH8_9ASTR
MSASSSQEEIPPPPPPPSQTPTQQTPHTVSTIKLPILKKGEYDIWAMKMSTIWPIQTIQSRRTAEEIVARERERKARTTLLMSLPEDHLAKFHKMTDAKEMWDAIKSRFGGNDESKKMQKYILKQQFEGFSYPNTKGITNDSGTQDNRRMDARNSGNKDGSRTGQKEDSKALVTVDGEGVDWTNHSEDKDYALMACNSSDSDTEVISCSNKCKESYANLKKLYDAQREQLSDASIEIKAYSQGLKKVKAQLVAHQQGQLWYEQKIKFMKIDLDDKTNVLTYHKKLLAEAQKEKDDLKAKVEKWHNSSKNLGKLLNSQMSAYDKFGLGYGDHRYNGILSYENEVLQSVFKGKESDFENQPINDRFAERMHAVPPPMIGNYMPSRPDVEVDDSNTEPSELVSEPVVNESNVESQPKVWSDAPIIEEYESDSEDECVSIPTKQQETPSFANKQVKTPRENVKNQSTHSQKPKVNKNDLGHGFAVRACFVCGSLNHLIRDCDFHEKRMARKVELNNGWNNVQRVNKQNQFVPSAVLTRTGIIPVNTARTSGTKNFSTARQSVNRQTVLTSSAMKVNTLTNWVLVTKPHNKTPYELLTGKIPIISYIRPFGCHVTILNTIDHLGKFAGKSDEGFLVGYSLQSKAFRVYNLETKRVEENLHITFLENKPNVAGKGPNWLFDLDYLTDSMNYHPVSSENQANLHAGQQEANQNAGTEEIIDVGDSDKEDESSQDCFVLPIWPSYSSTNTPAFTTDDKRESPREEDQVFMDELERLKRQEKEAYEEAEALRKKFETLVIKEGATKPSSTNIFSTVSTPAKASSTNLVNTVSLPVSTASPYEGLSLSDPTNSEEDDSEIPPLEDIYQNSTDGIFTTSSFDDEGDPNSAVQTRSKVNKSSGAHAFVSYVQKQKRTNHKDFHHCLFACFLSQHEPKKISEALEDESWVDAMQEELLQFKIQKVWVLVDLPEREEGLLVPSGLSNKKDEMRSFVRNKARLVAQEDIARKEGIDYDEVFAPVARLEAIRIFLAFASYMGFIVYQMDVKSAFLYGKIDEEVYVSQPPGFLDPKYPQEVYKVVKALYGLHQAPRACTMAVLDSCPKHNMVAYLEKSEGNAEFHEVIDFLKRSSIHHALTISPVVSTTFVEQFWTSAKSKTINNVRHITAKVAGKSVSISEVSIRSDLLFNDADGIDTLPNQAIFDAIQQMGIRCYIRRPFEALPTPSPAPTSEVPHEPQTDSSPAQTTSGENLGGHSSSDKSLSGNEGDMTLQSVYDLCLSLCAQVSDQAKEIQDLKAQITKLKKQAKPVIKHHKAYLKSVSLKQRFPRKSFSKKHRVHKESVSKQGRKFAKGESSVQRDPLFDEIPEDTVDHMDTENAQDEGRTREIVDEDKEIEENVLSTEDVLSTDKEEVSTDRPIVSTDGSKVSTDRHIEGTDEQVEGTKEHKKGTEEQVESTDGHKKGTEEEIAAQATQTSTQTPTSKIFGDDETIAKVLLNMSKAKAVSREKEKGVELKDVEETDRPKPTSTRSLLTLKPLPKIDPKDKGKKKIEEEDESESESDGIPEAEKKFKQLESDEEMARKIQEEWEEEEERNRIAEEQTANEALIRNFDDIKARIEADRLLAEKLQEQEREQFTIEERAKFLHDTIAAQRKFLAQQRSEAIRNRPPTKNQLRNQMMTYLKHVGNFKHAELKIKKFEEVQLFV